MVKFLVEIPDKVWQKVLRHKGLKTMWLDMYGDTVPLNNVNVFYELVGYTDLGLYGEVIDIRAEITVTED